MSLARFNATRQKATRSAFTLVELLVVITIIGLLAGLLTVGLYAAFNSSKNFVIANEITQVSTALESFKSKCGGYPPDMQSAAGFAAFRNKAYPRADRTAIDAFQNVLTANSKVIDPAEALVLYLAYTSKDPRYPFRFAAQMAADTGSPPVVWTNPPGDLEVFFEFPAGTLVDADLDGFPEFSQKSAKGAPLVYFDARSYTSTVNPTPSYFVSGNSVAPYKEVVQVSAVLKDYRFFNLKSYQLISAGQDGEFGVPDPIAGSPPTVFSVVLAKGNDYPLNPRPLLANEIDRLVPLPVFSMESCSKRDGDNMANFTSGKTFDAALAQ